MVAFSSDERVYLFIDGRYLRKNYNKTMPEWFGNSGEIDFSAVVNQFSHKRIYYYDALEDEPKEGETQEEADLRATEQEKLFARIQEQAGSILRLGSVTGKRRKRRQKKVDIFLALDMLNHAARRNMDKAVLLAGDRDFEPVVQEIANLGIIIEVVADPRCRAVELTNAADKFRPIIFLDYWNWSSQNLKSQFPIPTMDVGIQSDWPCVKTGLVRGFRCQLYNPRPNVFHIVIPDYKTGRVSFGNREGLPSESLTLDRIELFCKLQYGEIKWD